MTTRRAEHSAAAPPRSRPPSPDSERRITLARELVVCRVRLWETLVPRAHEAVALEAIARRDPPADVRRALDAFHHGRSAAARRELFEAIAWSSEQHAFAAAILAVAGEIDPAWAARIREARAPYLRARERLVRANLPLVVLFAKRLGIADVPLEDRIQDGMLGLLQAVDRFDPERGVRFATYAGWWIRHAITRALTDDARLVRVPTHVQALARKLRRARAELSQRLGREPDVDELATRLDASPAAVAAALAAIRVRTVVLDDAVEDRLPLPDASVTADADIDARHEHDLVVLELRDLSERERAILEQRFELAGHEQLTLQELGRRFGISRERVRQLQVEALAKLREAITARQSAA